ncbi:MAG: hypothetical protein IKP49_06335 [Treponema sp.]|nr:hypothetical protein [Treponema sp.]
MAENTIKKAKAQTLIYIYNSIFKEKVYKTQSEEQTEKFFAQVREIVPEDAKFFEPWFRAFVSVAKNDGKNSLENFLRAIDNLSESVLDTIANMENADYLPAFLQQGFAFFMYIDDHENAKRFWQFGADKGLFAKPNSTDFYEKFFKRFNSKEQFWVQFPPKMYFDEAKATEKCISDYKKSANTGDALLNSLNEADFDSFVKNSEGIDFGTKKVSGLSLLYYAIQRKTALKAGSKKFSDDLIQIQVTQMVSKLDLSPLPEDLRNKQYLEIYHQMRVTYEKSGLGKTIFNALLGRDEEIEGKIANLGKIIAYIIERTDDVDAFAMDAGNRTQANALLLAGETGDTETLSLLIKKGSDVDKALGHAPFALRYKDGKSVSTEIPNSLVYRMISFAQYDALKFYLSAFEDKARKSMTEKTSKCDITPLAYLILNTLYNSRTEEEYKKSKSLVEGFLPIFEKAGAKLDENTAFGSVKKLLGL